MKGAVCKLIYDEVIAENKKLKEELKFSHDCRCSARDAYESVIKKVGDENKELQEQLNEESQQRLKNKECWMKTQQEYHKLKEENEQLKEEINGDGWLKQGYKTDLSNSHKKHNFMFKQIVKLKEEIDSLQKSNQQKNKAYHRFKKQVKELQEGLDEE